MHWSDEQVRELALRYEDGDTFERIALDEGVPTTRIQTLLKGKVTPRWHGPRKGSRQQNRSDRR